MVILLLRLLRPFNYKLNIALIFSNDFQTFHACMFHIENEKYDPKNKCPLS